MKTFDNESGVAYVFFMIVALLILGSLVWMGISFGFNTFMVSVNQRIAEGQMSSQTADPIIFGMGLLGSVPIFLLIGVLVWAILAAVNREP